MEEKKGEVEVIEVLVSFIFAGFLTGTWMFILFVCGMDGQEINKVFAPMLVPLWVFFMFLIGGFKNE